jgi:hypothetical protein
MKATVALSVRPGRLIVVVVVVALVALASLARQRATVAPVFHHPSLAHLWRVLVAEEAARKGQRQERLRLAVVAASIATQPPTRGQPTPAVVVVLVAQQVAWATPMARLVVAVLSFSQFLTRVPQRFLAALAKPQPRPAVAAFTRSRLPVFLTP